MGMLSGDLNVYYCYDIMKTINDIGDMSMSEDKVPYGKDIAVDELESRKVRTVEMVRPDRIKGKLLQEELREALTVLLAKFGRHNIERELAYVSSKEKP